MVCDPLYRKHATGPTSRCDRSSNQPDQTCDIPPPARILSACSLVLNAGPERGPQHQATSGDATMKMLTLTTMISWAACVPALAQTASYPPLSQYMLPKEAEVALAKSAAPTNISDHASVKVLTDAGYQIIRTGDNGFVCMVM